MADFRVHWGEVTFDSIPDGFGLSADIGSTMVVWILPSLGPFYTKKPQVFGAVLKLFKENRVHFHN